MTSQQILSGLRGLPNQAMRQQFYEQLPEKLSLVPADAAGWGMSLIGSFSVCGKCYMPLAYDDGEMCQCTRSYVFSC